MANSWLRLYHEWDSDPKIQSMSEAMQRRFIMLLCSKCRGETLQKQGSAVTVTAPDTDTDTEQIQKKRQKKAAASGFVLPGWVDAQAWKAFEEMRRCNRHPLTDYARSLAIRKLAKLRTTGDDPADVLNQSTMNGWQGLFPLKENDNTGGKNNGKLGNRKADAANGALARAQAAVIAQDYGDETAGVNDAGSRRSDG